MLSITKLCAFALLVSLSNVQLSHAQCGTCIGCKSLSFSGSRWFTSTCASDQDSYVTQITIATTDDDTFSYRSSPASNTNQYYTGCSNTKDDLCKVSNTNQCGEEGEDVYVIVTCENWYYDCDILYDIRFVCKDKWSPTTTTTPTATIAATTTTTTTTPTSTIAATTTTTTTTPTTTRTKAPTTTSFAGSYTRISVTPDECDVSDNFFYQCSASYSITASGSSLTIKPTSTPTAEDCECATLSATVSGTSASGTYGGVLSFDLDQTSSGITVETTFEDMTCKGTYSEGTTTSTTSTTTSTTTTTSGVWTYSGADLLGLAMTGAAIYYQG